MSENVKKLIVFYSFTGNTEKYARERAKELEADICKLEYIKRPSAIKAYSVGCIGAMRGKTAKIKEIDADLNKYGALMIIAPVWAGNPAPPFNSIIEKLPEGKQLEIILVSASGKSSCREKVEARIKAKNCPLVSFTDVKIK